MTVFKQEINGKLLVLKNVSERNSMIEIHDKELKWL